MKGLVQRVHLAMRRVRGNLILESWNCFTFTRFVMAAGTVAVLIICRHGARTRCRDAISCRADPCQTPDALWQDPLCWDSLKKMAPMYPFIHVAVLGAPITAVSSHRSKALLSSASLLSPT